MVELVVPPDSLVRTLAGRFARELRERYGDAVHLVRLFGSFARGEAHEESDVDLAVVLEEADFDTRRKVIDLATDIGMPHDLRLSPTVFDRAT
ncbi:MAG TPA: nucleotidyltransferase domain-containing protein [Thermoanaerobaculia bacterium]|nr:nucleotidyltransferase domain-containing protein [Thermoanaerobaculia bacterium]